MTRYRIINAISTLTAVLIVFGMLAAVVMEWASLWIAIPAAVVVIVAFALILPSRRNAALDALAAGTCPWCGGGRIRHYPDQREAWFCRDCLSGFTARGKRVKHEQE